MRTKNRYTPFSLRFRRWSRAGYAIFCSLSCAVTIGCVAISISDKSLQKATGISKSSFTASDSESDRDKSMEILELEASLQQIQETSLVFNVTDCAAACIRNLKISFINLIG